MPRICLAAALFALPAAAAAQPAPPACATPEHRQFDFWVGRWQVSPTGQANVVAESLIERLYGGCAVREHWMPKANPGGGSLNSYVPAEKAWRQTWVGSGGERVEFKGGLSAGAMVLTGDWPGPDGKPRLIRMTYTRGPEGSVRQLGEQSLDAGRTWAPSFDFTYRPAK
jgi:hypothetical protein